MVNYRRSVLPGGIFFFTVTLHDRKSNLLIKHIDLLKKAFRQVKIQHPFQIKAYVILPEHLHMIWQLPEGDSNYSERWKKIKTFFSKSLRNSHLTMHKTKYNEYKLWQRRYWEHTIRDEIDLENHINYIHFNPIKHGLVNSLHNWPHSSFHHYLKNNRLPQNWGDIVFESNDSFGE